MKRGKKIDVVTISDGAQRQEVELRWDRDKGDFFAELGGIEYSSMTVDELKTKLREKLHEMVSYEFKWYIEVRFDLDASPRTIDGSGRSYSHSVDYIDLKETEDVVGFNFRFDVVERSQEISFKSKYFYGERKTVLERPVREIDGVLTPVGKHDSKYGKSNHSSSIKYTPERYAKLCAIRGGMRELARRLNEVVGGDGDAIMKVLDGLKGQPLALPAPEKKVRAK